MGDATNEIDLPLEVIEILDGVRTIVTVSISAWIKRGDRANAIGILITDVRRLCARTRTVRVGRRRVAAFITTLTGLRAAVADLHPPAAGDVFAGPPGCVTCAIALGDGRLWITDIPIAVLGAGGRA